MNHTKQAVLDTCVAGLAGQQVLEQTMEHMKENWPDVRRARVALRQLDAVAKCMEKQATTMACKIGMSMALKHRKKMQCQQPAAVAQTPLRQVTNFIADSSSASSTKKRAVCKSQSRIDRDVAPSMLQFTSPRVLRPRPVSVRLPPASPALLPVGAGGYFSSAEGRNIRAEVLVSKESRLATLLASRSYGKRSGGSFPPSSATLLQAPWCVVSYPRGH